MRYEQRWSLSLRLSRASLWKQADLGRNMSTELPSANSPEMTQTFTLYANREGFQR